MTIDFDTTDYLAHHGVLGMHWGVRKEADNAGPATKAADVQAKRDSRAAKYEAKSKDLQSQIDTIKAITTKSGYQARVARNKIQDLSEQKANVDAIAKARKSGHFTDGEKQLIAIGAIAGGIIASKYLHTGLESGAFRRLATIGAKQVKVLIGKEVGKNPFKFDAKLAEKNMSIDDIAKLVQSKINPKYGGIGTKMNCRRCTFSYEMRRRGFDVKATRTTNAFGQNAIGLRNALKPGEKSFATQGAKSEKTQYDKSVQELLKPFAAGARTEIKGDAKIPQKPGETFHDAYIRNKGINEKANAQSVLDTLSKQPERSRGELGVEWISGGAHSMAYEVINGKAVIFDNQTGKIYRTAADLAADKMGTFKSAGFTRLDNVNLNMDYLLRWMQSA